MRAARVLFSQIKQGQYVLFSGAEFVLVQRGQVIRERVLNENSMKQWVRTHCPNVILGNDFY